MVIFMQAVSGCVTTAEQGRRMEYRLASLEVMLYEEAEARNRAIEDEVVRLEGKIQELSEALENYGLTARKTRADVGVTVDSLQEEIRGLRGRIDELRFELDRGRQEHQRSKHVLERRIAGFEGEEAVAKLEAREAAEGTARPDSPEPFLEMARERVESGEYAIARNFLLEFQRRWPEHESADDAQFLVAETYFQEGDHRSAILEFNKIRERFPDSHFMARSLLRLGECFAALDLKREAGDFFNAVIGGFPDNPAAEEAKEKKKSLNIR